LWRGPIERARTPQWTQRHAPAVGVKPSEGISLPVLAEVGSPA